MSSGPASKGRRGSAPNPARGRAPGPVLHAFQKALHLTRRPLAGSAEAQTSRGETPCDYRCRDSFPPALPPPGLTSSWSSSTCPYSTVSRWTCEMLAAVHRGCAPESALRRPEGRRDPAITGERRRGTLRRQQARRAGSGSARRRAGEGGGGAHVDEVGGQASARDRCQPPHSVGSTSPWSSCSTGTSPLPVRMRVPAAKQATVMFVPQITLPVRFQSEIQRFRSCQADPVFLSWSAVSVSTLSETDLAAGDEASQVNHVACLAKPLVITLAAGQAGGAPADVPRRPRVEGYATKIPRDAAADTAERATSRGEFEASRRQRRRWYCHRRPCRRTQRPGSTIARLALPARNCTQLLLGRPSPCDGAGIDDCAAAGRDHDARHVARPSWSTAPG